MGFNEYDDDHILNICKIAGVDAFVGSQPKGYELEIQERGVGLSGGQKQTINLARSSLMIQQFCCWMNLLVQWTRAQSRV